MKYKIITAAMLKPNNHGSNRFDMLLEKSSFSKAKTNFSTSIFMSNA